MLHEDFYSSGTYLNWELGIFSGFVSADPSHPPTLVWNAEGNIGCFISGVPFHRDPSDANNIASTLSRLYEEMGLRAWKTEWLVQRPAGGPSPSAGDPVQ